MPDLEPASVAVPVGDVDALAHALRRLLPDRDRLRAMGEAARLRVEQDYSLRVTVERLGLVYTDLSSQSEARALVDCNNEIDTGLHRRYARPPSPRPSP